MSIKNDKRSRKIIKKQRKLIVLAFFDQLKGASFFDRLKIAWAIIINKKGAKSGREK